MKLYYSTGTCSLAVRIVIHEIGAPCDYERVDLRTKKTASGQDYFTINPKGAVPFLMLDDLQTLSENAVIQQYLADHYGATALLPPLGNIQRYQVLEWLNYISTELHKGCVPLFPLFSAKLDDDVKKNVFIPALLKKLSYVDAALKQDFLMGDHFTLPDAYLFVVLKWLPGLGIELPQFKNLSRYFAALQGRPSIVESLKEEQSALK